MVFPPLCHTGRVLLLAILLTQTACDGKPIGAAAPLAQAPARTNAPPNESSDTFGANSLLLKHAIVPAAIPAPGDSSESDPLARITEFSYELQTRVVDPTALHDLVIHPHTPLASESLGKTERYGLAFAPGRLILVQLEGSRPMSRIKVAFSLDGAPLSQPAPLSVSAEKQIVECAWNEDSSLDLTLTLDGFTLAETDSLRFSFDGNAIASEAVPQLDRQMALWIRDSGSAPQALETQLIAFLDATLGNFPAYHGAVTVHFAYSLSAAPDQLVTLPVAVLPSIPLEQASRGTTAKVIAQAIRTWHEEAQPAAGKYFRFALQVHEPETRVPLLNLTDARLPLTVISDL